MMKLNMKAIAGSVALSAIALLPAGLEAQATTPYVVMAGSSAMFNTMGFAAFEQNNQGYNLCGPHHWSYKGGAAGSATFVGIHDSRSSAIADEPATVWVSWNDAEINGGTNPKVCAFAQVDSTVGVRAAFARTSSGTPAASISINASFVGVAGQNKVPAASIADEALPANVYTTLNGAAITVAAADIRPEDAKFATTRTLTALGTNMTQSLLNGVKGLGYANPSTPGIGYPIQSSQSTTIANPVDFALFGSDPISGGAAASTFAAYQVGAGPAMIFVNTSNSAAYHLGDASLTNINSSVLSGFLDGTYSRTRDMFNATGVADYPVKTFIREPLSGTMNVVEYNVPNSFRYFTSQEKGVLGGAPSSSNTSNPLALAGNSTGSGRYRAVGTGEEVSTVIKAANADSLGYAFWSYGNFAAVTSGSIARYLTVDGVDPLYSGPSANPNGVGVFPTKSGSTYPVLTFPNIVNGSYPAWTIFRLIVVPEANKSAVQNFVTIAQDDAAVFSDFIPAPSLKVFRSHFYTANIGGDDGHVFDSADGVYYPEAGGDVGGTVYPIQADYDFIADSVANGNGIKQLINRHQ